MKSKRDEPPPPDAGMDELQHALAQCSRASAMLDALRDLYRQAEAEIAALGPSCKGCGECCHFETAGHRLYASTVEIALLLSEPPCQTACHKLRCHYHIGTNCTARQHRPLGCRTYFCDSLTEIARMEVHEKYHRNIRQLHDLHKVQYMYMECTAATTKLSF